MINGHLAGIDSWPRTRAGKELRLKTITNTVERLSSMSSNVFPMALVKGVARHQIPQIDDDCASVGAAGCACGQGRRSGWVWWYIGLGVGLKLIALWLATLCKIGGMQCSELLKEFRNSFCFLPAALDFEQLFFTRSFFVRTAKCCELLLNFAFCMRYVGF